MAAEPPPMDDMFADEKGDENSQASGGSRMEDVVLSNPASMDVEHSAPPPTLRTTDEQRNAPVVAPFRSFEEFDNKPAMRSADEVSFSSARPDPFDVFEATVKLNDYRFAASAYCIAP